VKKSKEKQGKGNGSHKAFAVDRSSVQLVLAEWVTISLPPECENTLYPRAYRHYKHKTRKMGYFLKNFLCCHYGRLGPAMKKSKGIWGFSGITLAFKTP